MSSGDTRVKVVRRRDNLLMGASWGARCAACNEWLTKYDETEGLARLLAVAALAKHRCAHV